MSMDRSDYIRSKVPEAERLAVLAEEATELAHAALKMRRTLIFNNPTPIDYEIARGALLEEFADVVLCMDAVGISDSEIQEMEKIAQYKKRRC